MTDIELLAKTFRAAANAAVPMLQRVEMGYYTALMPYNSEQNARANIVYSVLCAIASAYETAAKEE